MNMSCLLDGIGRQRGRPRKFMRPSHAVSVTLPDDVVVALSRIDDDLSRAVVRLADRAGAPLPHPPAELATFGRKAVIVIDSTKTLEERAGVFLIPISEGRALISFDEPMTAAELELSIRDTLQDHTLIPDDERIFAAVGEILSVARSSRRVSLRHYHVIVLQSR